MTRTDTDGGSSLSFSDTVQIEADKAAVWNVLSDAEALAAAIPGAEDVTRHSKRRYSLAITRGISHVTVSLDGELELVEMNEPDWIIAEGEAFDSTTGSPFEVIAGMEMAEDGEGVALSYSAELSYSGGVARFGARLLRRIIESDVNRYFENVKDAVESS
jgi:hypothetical protein